MKNEDIGKLLKELRIKHGYTQAELANLLNVTYQAVSRWEKGINTPNLLTLVALKKLYKISIDELLLEVERKIVEPVEKKLHWTIQYFLLPLALIILSFGIAQFYFFLNVFFAMIIFSIFIGVILSAVMLLIKFKQKGILFLIVLGLLMLINGTVYITNMRYFNLMEVPYYQESDHLILPFDYTNSIPINIDYILDDEPYALIYHLGKPNIQTYQLESNLSQMMTNIDTINLEIDDMVIIGEYAYFSTYFEDSSTSDIYQMNLRTHEILFLTTLNMQIELCESDTSLYIYESYGGFLDFETTILRWNGVAIEEVVSFDFEIVDMLYNDSLERFYISVNQNNVYNIRIYDDQFIYQDQVFNQGINDYIKLKYYGRNVLASYDNKIVSILFSIVEETGLNGTVEDIYDTGYFYFYRGDIVDSQWRVLTQNAFYNKQWQSMGASHMFYRESDSKLIAIDQNRLSLLQHYSRQVEEIMIPSYARHAIFFSVIPFIALCFTLGISNPKKKET